MTQYTPLKEELKNWNLQHDNQCFQTIQNFTGSLMNKANEIYHSFQDTEYNINNYASVVNNNFSKFMNISNSKFTENKLEEIIDSQFQPKPMKKQEEPQQQEPDVTFYQFHNLYKSVIKQRFKTAIDAALNTCNIEPYIDQSDSSNEEMLSSTGSSDDRLSQFSSVAGGKGNNFPSIIGSQSFFNDPFIGIRIEEPEQIIKIKVDPVTSNLNILSGHTQLVQSIYQLDQNAQQQPQMQLISNSQFAQSIYPSDQNIPQAPSLPILQNVEFVQSILPSQITITLPPQKQNPQPQQQQQVQQQGLIYVQQGIPQAPPLFQGPELPKITISSTAPPPPPLNVQLNKPNKPALPKLPVEQPVPKPPTLEQPMQQSLNPDKSSEQSIQEAFQKKLKEMQDKQLKKSQLD